MNFAMLRQRSSRSTTCISPAFSSSNCLTTPAFAHARRHLSRQDLGQIELGSIYMYHAEVLGKFPVMQQILFDSSLAWIALLPRTCLAPPRPRTRRRVLGPHSPIAGGSVSSRTGEAIAAVSPCLQRLRLRRQRRSQNPGRACNRSVPFN
ncbi:hypothetical protein K466DRAFT_346695 [Polyporus arcularius HHB13444]|uniref:Uncharacterized protein n=1 Tax=Polyporus arcularius HHB13444 TaxID=1314778 RepID=A0A5C3NYX1_9APHY|nr:hypothetical protein K466DRAFT_346695 [Polyporus arcularius HHB13444]